MENVKSHGEKYLLITEALLADISSAIEEIQWFPRRELTRTLKLVRRRYREEGLGFFTKTLPRFGKALDRALSGSTRLSVQGFKTLPGSSLPLFMGELTRRVFNDDGWIKPDPCIDAVRNLRLLMSLWYKLELTYETRQEAKAYGNFKATELELPSPSAQYVECPSCGHQEDQFGYFSDSRSVGATSESVTSQRAVTNESSSDVAGPVRSGAGSCELGDVRTGGSAGTRVSHAGLEPVKRFDSRHERDRVSPKLEKRDDVGRPDNRREHDRGAEGSIPCAHGRGPTHEDSRGPEEIGPRNNREGRENTREACDPRSEEEGGSKCCPECGIKWNERCLERGTVIQSHYAVTGAARWSDVEGLTFRLTHNRLYRTTRRLLTDVLYRLDLSAIIPKNGPGAVSDGESRAEKRWFRRYIPSIARHYPYDQYFYWSPTHLVDEHFYLVHSKRTKHPTNRASAVPKDSRGPRVISCEVAEVARIQAGIWKVLVEEIHRHPFTKGKVSFVDQTINGRHAAAGSRPGGPATLDLKDASDRVSIRLIQEVWPQHISDVLLSVRSTHTKFPDGELLPLKKFAPMGSYLCFPVMALTIWAVSTACLLEKYSCWSPQELETWVSVYGDDVATPENDATDVAAALEAVGLKINVDKSYTTGLFKEACGEDWFAGHRVNGIKFRKPWSSRRSAEHYTAWIEYSNSMYARRCYRVAELIASELEGQYGSIPRYPGRSPKGLPFPALIHSLGQDLARRPIRQKWDKATQSWLYNVWAVRPEHDEVPKIGWCDLLELTSGGFAPNHWSDKRLREYELSLVHKIPLPPLSQLTGSGQQTENEVGPGNTITWNPLRSIAKRKTSKLVRVWRGDRGL